MQSSDADKYRGMLVEIKGRTSLIRHYGSLLPANLPLPAQCEFLYLHLRKIIELIARGSLLANAKALNLAEEKIQRYWNAKDLLADLKNLNPEFYPHPIVQKDSVDPKIAKRWLDRGDDYLTQERFISLYNICGSLLHTRNPFKPEPDYGKRIAEVADWMKRIVNLLNAHKIRIYGDPNLYLFQMGSDAEQPSYTVFAPAPRT